MMRLNEKSKLRIRMRKEQPNALGNTGLLQISQKTRFS